MAKMISTGKASARRGTTGANEDRTCGKEHEARIAWMSVPICYSKMRQRGVVTNFSDHLQKTS